MFSLFRRKMLGLWCYHVGPRGHVCCECLCVCVCLFTPCNFETNKRIFIKTDLNMSCETVEHLQRSRHDAANLLSPPSVTYVFSLGRFPRSSLAHQCDITPGLHLLLLAIWQSVISQLELRGLSRLHGYRVTER